MKVVFGIVVCVGLLMCGLTWFAFSRQDRINAEIAQCTPTDLYVWAYKSPKRRIYRCVEKGGD